MGHEACGPLCCAPLAILSEDRHICELKLVMMESSLNAAVDMDERGSDMQGSAMEGALGIGRNDWLAWVG